MQLDRRIPERYVPARPDLGSQRLRDPLGQAAEAHGSGRQAQVEKPEGGDHENDQPQLHIESTTQNAPEQASLGRVSPGQRGTQGQLHSVT
jgi:hypothetical protein